MIFLYKRYKINPTNKHLTIITIAQDITRMNFKENKETSLTIRINKETLNKLNKIKDIKNTTKTNILTTLINKYYKSLYNYSYKNKNIDIKNNNNTQL